jgi:Predicted metal-binding protein related to the C-terminal domain of SecA
MSGKRISRNAPCPCGSGKKFKHCCLAKGIDWEARQAGGARRMLPGAPRPRPAAPHGLAALGPFRVIDARLKEIRGASQGPRTGRVWSRACRMRRPTRSGSGRTRPFARRVSCPLTRRSSCSGTRSSGCRRGRATSTGRRWRPSAASGWTTWPSCTPATGWRTTPPRAGPAVLLRPARRDARQTPAREGDHRLTVLPCRGDSAGTRRRPCGGWSAPRLSDPPVAPGGDEAMRRRPCCRRAA